ncbi:MAG: 4a-hydroxytetrahydrobiopterin dehydratase [Patescibacteria group bacterium]
MLTKKIALIDLFHYHIPMSSLHFDTIQPLPPGTECLPRKQAIQLAIEAGGWMVSPDTATITKDFRLESFQAAMNFINIIGSLAMAQKYYPAIALEDSKITIALSSPEVKGLSKNDFVMAAKITHLL